MLTVVMLDLRWGSMLWASTTLVGRLEWSLEYQMAIQKGRLDIIMRKNGAHILFQRAHVCLTFTVGLAEGEALRDGVDKEVGSRVGPCVAHDMEPQRHKDGNSDSTFWHADASLYPRALCNHNILAPHL